MVPLSLCEYSTIQPYGSFTVNPVFVMKSRIFFIVYFSILLFWEPRIHIENEALSTNWVLFKLENLLRRQ